MEELTLWICRECEDSNICRLLVRKGVAPECCCCMRDNIKWVQYENKVESIEDKLLDIIN